MSEDFPTAVWSGKFRLFGIEVLCYRLEDGRNIIEAESMKKLLEAMATGNIDVDDIKSFANFQAGKHP